jgi:regulator of protease activity HflC (stomatin/prohibitin superfamily)
MFRRIKIKANQKGFYFKDGAIEKVLSQGKYWIVSPFAEDRMDLVSTRELLLEHWAIDLVVKSGLLKDEAITLELKDHERALVWVDNRFERLLLPGTYILWNEIKKVKVEIADARKVRFEHEEFEAIIKSKEIDKALDIFTVSEGFEGLFFLNGELVSRLNPGRYAFWKNQGMVKLYHKDMRETVLDIAGQDIMTKDKVTLRVNAVLTYRITDSVKAVLATSDAAQSLYRDAQLAVREVIGTRELDAFLADKDSVSRELESLIKIKAGDYGIGIVGLGIRDIILPGEMKELLNKVTEAKKASEANLITRREEVAAIRTQMNTAKMLEDSPMLLKLKELEVLERIAASSKLNLILGNEKLTEKVINLI